MRVQVRIVGTVKNMPDSGMGTAGLMQRAVNLLRQLA
jgi:hypothetical protein